MSVDKSDVSLEAQTNLQNIAPQMWAISIGNPAWQLNVPYEIGITPCDHIWMPACYDPSIATMPTDFVAALKDATPSGGQQTAVLQAVNYNTFPVYDPSSTYTSGGNPTLIAPPLFSLRFNSINAPWLCWGTPLPPIGFTAPGSVSGQPSALPVGASDGMRSISGIITRLWVKYNSWAQYATANVHSYNAAGSGVVLLSSMGFRQQTPGTISFAANYADGTPSTGFSQLSTSIEGGGYTTPQLNTTERAILENLGQPGALSGVAGAASSVAVPVRRSR
jgi:hypothetical protein